MLNLYTESALTPTSTNCVFKVEFGYSFKNSFSLLALKPSNEISKTGLFLFTFFGKLNVLFNILNKQSKKKKFIFNKLNYF